MKLNKLPLNVIGLNRVGLNQIGSPSRRANTSDRPYIDPEVLASLVAVCICDGKSNDDPDRAVIKNLVDPDNPFVISNAAFKLNSGFGKYEEDFTDWIIYPNIKVTDSVITTDGNFKSSWFIYKHSSESKINEMNIKVSGIPKGGKILYFYISDETANLPIAYTIPKDGIYHLPESKINNNRASVGFTVESRYDWNNIRIEQIPSFEGAFVTDGKDDLITSTKTVKEMLGGSNEVTVVSMMANLDSSQIMCNSNFSNTNGYNVRNTLEPNGVISMLGYTDKNGTTNNLNLIMGDKNSIKLVDKVNFNSDYVFHPSSYNVYSFKTAWYWTIIANKVLTTDQINQVISYFNLDKHVKPDIIYDTIRQGITNENHASFNDELVDFSGNGHNLKLYNLNWDKQSGIGSYPFSFKDYNYFSDRADVSVNKSNFVLTANFDGNNFLEINTKNTEVPSFKIKAEGIDTITNGRLAYRIAASDGSISVKYISEDGEYEIPGSPLTENAAHSGFYVSGGINDNVRVKVTIIPDYEGALVSDGIGDYGKVENLPIYKDYTVVADREIVDGLIDNADGGVATRSYNYAKGAFGFDWKKQAFSFGGNTDRIIDVQRFISYQSKYVNNGIQLITGNVVDNNPLYMARLGEENRYSKLALWSFLLFPYTLSEFLLERQLKRYKLGTLYPDMIEWRPIAKSNIPYKQIDYFIKRSGAYVRLNPGDYFQSTEDIIVRVTPIRDWQLDVVSSIKVNGKNEVISVNSSYAQTAPIHIDKSPQKINITIDEYIRYENIVQPYPAIINLKQDGKTITWGDKLKVGSDIVFVESANLLPELYTVSETRYNGVTLYPNTIIKVEKSMVFDNARTYLKANEPSCILSPNRLRIPNSSYKILGYIPDLTGKGNHGRLNNFAYTEESGANEDGSIRFDGTDDYITIPNVIGGKCIMAKVTINRNSGIIYDQRRANVPNKSWMQLNPSSVIFEQNAVSTYIDGILNHNVTGSDLVSKTVNLTCELEIGDTSGTYQPTIGSSYAVGYTTNINLYEFMLFPDVPDEEEIKELNEIMGIENNIEVS